MKYWHKIVAFSMSLSLSLMACNTKNVVHTNFDDIPQETWKWDNAISFEFDIDDSTITYNHFINYRLTDRYAKANIYVIRKIINPLGDTSEQLLNSILFTPEGTAKGSKSGRFINIESPIEVNRKVVIMGKYRVILIQHTREFDLAGVNAIGYTVTKGEPVF